MKTYIAKLSSTIISIIILAALLTLSVNFAGKLDRHQSAALSHSEYRPEITGNMYGEVINSFFAASR